MICVRVGDGLGNQLFNYAFGYALAKKNNTKLILDISSFDDAGSREYKLDEFSITFNRKKNWHNSTKVARVYKEICKRVFWSVHYEKNHMFIPLPKLRNIEITTIRVGGSQTCISRNIRRKLCKSLLQNKLVQPYEKLLMSHQITQL